MSKSDKHRNAELAKIHILAKKELGMNEDEYRCMLQQITGQTSAGKLNWRQRSEVIDHLRSLIEGPKYPGRPRNMDGADARAQHLQKIEALLAIGEKPWPYVDAMALRMYGIERVQWIEDLEQLRGIITALRKQAKREGRDLRD